MDHPFVIASLVACGLLLVGFVLRATVRPLQVLFIPASVVGGLVGLALMQVAVKVDAVGLEAPAAAVGGVLGGWPGVLIAVVFAGLLLERSGKSFREAAGRAARQGIVVWIIVLGQAAVGLLLMWLVVAPGNPGLPMSLGQLIETGFAGGHGTAGAMGEVWDKALRFPAGKDLAFLFATYGLVYGTVSGIILINLGVRLGWTRAGRVEVPVIKGLEPRLASPPAAYAKVAGEVIDPFVFQLLIVASAFAAGYGLQQLFIAIASSFVPPPPEGALPDDPSKQALKAIGNIPLFLFTLMGGWLVRELMRLLGLFDLIDPQSVRRIVALAMEFLIVAAIATLRIEAIADYWLLVVVLLAAGSAWAVFCLLVVGRRLLPREYWFELGLINYGMSCATTAQGMMLLRIVDPDLESGAAEDYAVAAPLSAPFIGGGVITLSLPLLLDGINAVHVAAVVLTMAAVLTGLYVLGAVMARRARTI